MRKRILKSKAVTLTNGKAFTNVDLTRWTGDPNFYKVYERDSKTEKPVNVSQILMIEDYVES